MAAVQDEPGPAGAVGRPGVIHLTWEYPPLVYGGIARHVHELSIAQARAGHSVTVITQAHPDAPADSMVDGVRVIRVAHDPPALAFDEQSLLAWVFSLNSALSRELVSHWRHDLPPGTLLHAHDWVVAQAAAMGRLALGVPLVTTMHATEAGRHQGWIPTDLSHAILQIETWLAGISDRLITCSRSMRGEVDVLFGCGARTSVIPNGIDPTPWSTTDRQARGPGPLVVFAGRLEWEKGVFDLLEAVERLGAEQPDLSLVMAGTGGQRERLDKQIAAAGLSNRVRLVGRLGQPDLAALFARADVVVVPSRYEPFGLIALEAAAAGAPLVVSDTGGLADIADDGAAALVVTPGDVAALAAAISDVVDDPPAATRRAAVARANLALAHDWARIADQTAQAYGAAVANRAAGRTGPSPREHRPAQASALDPFGEAGPPRRPTGNLLRSTSAEP